ncbi:MAG TPA: HEAT repeat domain-containing protein, partial [Planctomycetota bacterium]|nr:HEAT repeat domain-containing protein [Planctomycetota bacterium]
MDTTAFRKYVTEERFEVFCRAALSECVLPRKGRKTFTLPETPAAEQSPFDAEFIGEWLGHKGKFLLEFKSADPGRDVTRQRAAIRKDLCGDERRKGKLLRAAEREPNAAAYVLVMAVRATDAFLQGIRRHLKEHRICFGFEVLDLPVVEKWLQDYPELHKRFRPPEEKRSLPDFIERLIEQGAPVNFPPYKRLDELYQPPREFGLICDILRTKHIVFITGPPQVGKTFTAAYILWHHYREYGWEPQWLFPLDSAAEPAPGGPRIRRVPTERSIIDLVAQKVGPNRAVYVEDIFGKTPEQEIRGEMLDANEVLRGIVDLVKGGQHSCCVIVTSRKEIFDRAVKKDRRLREFVVDLKTSLTLGSYTTEQRAGLLRRYAELYGCTWLEGEALPADVTEAAEILQAPGAIRYYCQAGRDASTAAKRQRHLRASRKELVNAFANQIACLDELPLAVLLTAHYFGALRRTFQAALPRLVAPDAPTALRSAGRKLEHIASVGGPLTFAHPDYAAAIRLVMKKVRNVRRLFHELATNLANAAPELRGRAALGLCWNYAELDKAGREILSKLTADPDRGVRRRAAWALGVNYENLDKVGREILRELSAEPDPEVRGEAADGLGLGREKLDKAGWDILRQLARDPHPKVREKAAWALAGNYDGLDKAERNILRQLTRDPDPELRRQVAWALGWNYTKLDKAGRDMLGQLARDPHPKGRGEAAGALGRNYDNLDKAGHAMLRQLARDADPEVR